MPSLNFVILKLRNVKPLFFVSKYVLLILRKFFISNTHEYYLEELKLQELFVLKDKGRHVFFGYYDKSPVNVSNSRILYLSAPIKRNVSSAAKVCVYDVGTRQSFELDQTFAWNWQQGAMMQWIGDKENYIIYNTYLEEEGHFGAKVYYFLTKEYKTFPMPIYSMGKNDDIYLSVNFVRLSLYAKGYGYDVKRKSADLNDAEDGIWEFNMKNNSSKLLFSIEMLKRFSYRKDFDNSCHYINHVEYCKYNTKILFIHRWLKKGGIFKSRLLLFDKMTQNFVTLLDNGHVSHFCWKSEEELFIYATNRKGIKGYFSINIDKVEESEIYDKMPLEDGHPSFNLTKKYILTDSYPNNCRRQMLFLYNIELRKLYKLKEFYSPLKYFDDYRCDLHPRWNMDSGWVSVDTTHWGNRCLAFYKLN